MAFDGTLPEDHLAASLRAVVRSGNLGGVSADPGRGFVLLGCCGTRGQAPRRARHGLWIDGACVGMGYTMLAGGGECCERRGYYFRAGQECMRRWMWKKGSC